MCLKTLFPLYKQIKKHKSEMELTIFKWIPSGRLSHNVLVNSVPDYQICNNKKAPVYCVLHEVIIFHNQT